MRTILTNRTCKDTVWARWYMILVVIFVVPTISLSQFSNPAPVPLLTAGNYGALASTGITGSATVNGDVGTVTGSIDETISPTGSSWGVGGSHNSQAQIDLAAALSDASGRTSNLSIADALGGQTLHRGVYGGGALDLASGQTLTLDALGDANAIFIIKASSTLTINSNSTVALANGAAWSNVFWYVGSDATINGGSSSFNGIVLATTSITLTTGSTVSGRLLANGGAVTINSAVLPVELVALTVTANRKNAVLQWSTATETDNEGFEIDRRQNQDWQKIGFVAGAGTSSWPRDYSYTDYNLSPGKYGYRIKQLDRGGSFKYHEATEVEITSSGFFALESNFPNPFNPSTTFSFSLPANSFVSLTIYDALGREVSVVLSEELPAGNYARQWNAKALPSGVYFYRLVANVIPFAQKGSFDQTKKFLLLK